MNSYQTTFYFGSVWKGYNVDNRRMLPECWSVSVNVILIYRDVHYCVIICPDHRLLIGYDALRRDERMNMFIFRRSWIDAESKSNRSCNSRFRSRQNGQLEKELLGRNLLQAIVKLVRCWSFAHPSASRQSWQWPDVNERTDQPTNKPTNRIELTSLQCIEHKYFTHYRQQSIVILYFVNILILNEYCMVIVHIFTMNRGSIVERFWSNSVELLEPRHKSSTLLLLYFTKRLQLLGDFPRHLPGFCPCTPLGTSTPRPPYFTPPNLKFWIRPEGNVYGAAITARWY